VAVWASERLLDESSPPVQVSGGLCRLFYCRLSLQDARLGACGYAGCARTPGVSPLSCILLANRLQGRICRDFQSLPQADGTLPVQILNEQRSLLQAGGTLPGSALNFALAAMRIQCPAPQHSCRAGTSDTTLVNTLMMDDADPHPPAAAWRCASSVGVCLTRRWGFS
jgi:hypothetical protein